MKLNIDSYLEAVEKPELTINGQTYVAKHLSFNDALKFQSRFEQGLTAETIPTFVKELCQAVGLPGDVILELPPAAFQHVLERFLVPLVGGQTNG